MTGIYDCFGYGVFHTYCQCVIDCYDSCHHVNYAPDDDLIKRYGNRLMALHLQDNGGKHNQHQLPFDGSIDWVNVMKKRARKIDELRIR